MNTPHPFTASIFFLSLSALAGPGAFAVDPPAGAAPGQVQPGEDVSEVMPLPATPAPIRNILYARQFTLTQGYEFEWRSDHPTVTSGWLLVLDVTPALVFPRQVAEPVLYVGDTTAERVNIGHESGRIVVIVPSALDKSGEVAMKLDESIIWFGNPALPEQVSPATVQAERRAAANAGITTLPAENVELAISKSIQQGTLHAANREELRHAAAGLIKLHSPQETVLADQILQEGAAPAPEGAMAK